MDTNERKARFSLSYIEAVASHAGFQVVETKVDRDSVDGVLMADFGRRPRVEFQAKATSRDVVRQSEIHFPISIKNYNDLRIEAINPRILIVLIMPSEADEWLAQNYENSWVDRAYWRSLEGMPSTSNTNSVTVRMPMNKILSSDQLVDMMRRAERTGTL